MNLLDTWALCYLKGKPPEFMTLSLILAVLEILCQLHAPDCNDCRNFTCFFAQIKVISNLSEISPPPRNPDQVSLDSVHTLKFWAFVTR